MEETGKTTTRGRGSATKSVRPTERHAERHGTCADGGTEPRRTKKTYLSKERFIDVPAEGFRKGLGTLHFVGGGVETDRKRWENKISQKEVSWTVVDCIVYISE